MDVAGGETLRARLDPEQIFDRLLNRISGFYRLGVSIPPASVNKPSLAVKVRVRGSGLTVKTASRIVRSTSPEPPDNRPMPQRLFDLVGTGGSADAIPIELATTVRRDDSGGRVRVTTTVLIPAGRAGPFTAAVAMINETDGSLHRGLRAIPHAPEGDVRTSFSFDVPAGRYQMRVAVADASGRIGIAEQPVLARLRPLGNLYASDLKLLWSPAASDWQPLGFDDLPRSAVNLRAELQLYTPGPLAATPVRIALFRDGDDQPSYEQNIQPILTGTVADVTADFPLGALEPGAYAVRATVLIRENATGVVSATFRKRTPAPE